MTEKRDASSIYEDLKALHAELEALAHDGRITMDQDSLNTDYRDTSHALMTAFESMETAIAATCWMETDR